jgi:hypothetical protein
MTHRRVPIFSKGRILTVLVPVSEASRVGGYMSAVNQFLQTNDESFIEQFDGESIVDHRGAEYFFETRPNVVYRLTATQTESFEEVYRIVR